MNIIFFEKLRNKVADFIFPKNERESKNINALSKMARLRFCEGDNSVKYDYPTYNFFPYRMELVKAAIWKLKYRGDLSFANHFGQIIYEHIGEELSDLFYWQNFRRPILIPIPVSKRKKRIRGFNQSAAICKAISAIDMGNFFEYSPDVLYKIKDTKSQAQVKDKKTRLENLKDSFSLKDRGAEKLKGQNVILLDDVLTTGSTLSEASKILETAEIKSLIWLVMAH